MDTNTDEANEPVNDDGSGGVTRRQALRLLAASGATAAVGQSAVGTVEAGVLDDVTDWVGGGVETGSKVVSGAKSVATDNKLGEYAGDIAEESGYTQIEDMTTIGGRRYQIAGGDIEIPEISLANHATFNALAPLATGAGMAYTSAAYTYAATSGWLSGRETGTYDDYTGIRQSQREVDAVYDTRTIDILRGSDATVGLSTQDVAQKFGLVLDGEYGYVTDTKDPMNTAFSDVLSTEIRAAVSKVRANDGTEVDAINAARDKADMETTTSIIELIEFGNGITRALIDPVASTVQENSDGNRVASPAVEVYQAGTSSNFNFRAYPSDTGEIGGEWSRIDLDVDWESRDRSPPDNYVDATGLAWSTAYQDGTWSLPMDPSEAGYESPPVIVALAHEPDGTSGESALVTPVPPSGTDAIDWPHGTDHTIHAEHPDLSINPRLYEMSVASAAIEQVYLAWDEWRSGITDFVGNLWDAFESGDLDADDIVSIEDLIQRYDETDGLSRLKLEMAILTETGSNINLKVTLDHPDVGEVTGHLGIEFADSATADTRDLTAGETLAAADYESAYVIIPDESSGSGDLQMLDATEDLTIIDVQGGAEDVAAELDGHSAEITSGDPGDVIIDTEGDTVDALENPGGYSVGIEVADANGATEVLNPDGFEPVSSGSDAYSVDGYAAPTTLAAGDATVTAVDLATFSGRVTTPKNVTDVSEIESELADLRQTNAELEEQLRDEVLAGGGGDGSGGNGWYYAVGGAVAATAAALGLSGGVGE